MKIIQRPSPNFDDRGGESIRYIILHYTGMPSAHEALDRLCCVEEKVSSHYTIDEDGTIYQHVSEEKRAWHAGQSSWQGQTNINAKSIGIEIVNPGHEFGYRPFPIEQINAVIDLCKAIQERHPIEFILAHSDIAPDRKQDPGELFPWQRLAQEGIGEWPDISEEDILKGGVMYDMMLNLREVGYEASKSQNMLIAFQRHFVPEAFANGTQGIACRLTKARLYALLSGHLISYQ